MTAGYSAWPFTGRNDLIQRTVTAVNEGRGAVLLGGQGMGKTALAHQVLDAFRDHCHVIHLRATPAYSHTSYGCLGVLLSGVAPISLNHPVAVLHSLLHRISEAAQGRKTVLFVDNAQHLDPASATAISQLAHYGSATVIAACNNLLAAPAEITRLWRDGLLRRIDIDALTAAEAAAMLAAGLNGRLSRWASMGLWQASGGNPLLLQGLARELVDRGQLQRQGGIWVRNVAFERHSEAFMELMSSRLGQMPPAEREALEIISLAGTIDFDLLLAMVEDGATIDALQEAGVIDVVFDQRPVARMHNTLAAEVLGGTVPVGRRLALLERIESTGSDAIQLEDNVCSMAAWSLSCGRNLDEGAVLHAARVANRRSDPHAALQFLARLPAGHSTADAGIEEARAWLALGHPLPAGRALDRCTAFPAQTLSMRQWAELALTRLILEYRNELTAGAAGKILQEARDRLAVAGKDDPALAGDELPRLLEAVELVELEVLAFHGHYDQIRQRIESGDSVPLGSANARLVADSRLCEALALTGDHAASGVLAVDIRERMKDANLSARVTADIFLHLFTARFWSGDWNMEVTAKAPSHGERFSGPDDELAEGVLHACCGRAGRALELLVPAVAQARVNDPSGLLPLGLAAAGYAYALDGKIESAQLTLADDGLQLRERLPWQLAQAIDYLVALAAARISRHHAPVTALLTSIGGQPTASPSHELLLVSSAVRVGGPAMSARLQAAADKCRGDFGRLCSLLARGVESTDSELLLQAAELAHHFGNDLFCYDVAKLTVSTATATRNAGRVRAAQELLGASRTRLGWRSGSIAANRGLTTREREIALRAARGEPSRSIAKDLSVSVRTVEGHLHQVYGKLHVNSRVDLIDALA